MLFSVKTYAKIYAQSSLIKKTSLFIAIFFILLLLSACSMNETQALPVVSDYMPEPVTEIKHLRVGVVSGPYKEMFEEAILPSLEDMGYTASFELYSDYESPNFALEQNVIDMNIFQHYAYLTAFKFENDLALSAIIEIPTVSMSIFSKNIRSLEAIQTGVSISIPDDTSNLARALRVLEAAGMITLNSAIDKSKAIIDDVVLNPHRVQLIPLPAHELVDSLDLYDASIIPGNFAVSSGLDLSNALYREALTENYKIVIAVRTGDLNKQFVRDIIGVLHSDNFREIITAPAGSYASFQLPRWLHDAMDSVRRTT